MTNNIIYDIIYHIKYVWMIQLMRLIGKIKQGLSSISKLQEHEKLAKD